MIKIGDKVQPQDWTQELTDDIEYQEYKVIRIQDNGLRDGLNVECTVYLEGENGDRSHCSGQSFNLIWEYVK